MRSVISTTALSLHYLHLYKFLRYLGGCNYLLSSAREAISASSPNASLLILPSTTPSLAVPAISSENHIQLGSSKLPTLHSFLYKSFNVLTN